MTTVADALRRATLALLLVLAPLAGFVAPAAAQTVSGPNLLTNPSFEDGMYHVSMSNFLADGWSEWYQHRAPDDPRGNWLPEPEYGIIADRPGQTHSGSKSQRWFNTWAIHNAGIYQTATVPPDAWLRFSIWMFDWSSQNDTFGVSDGFHHKWVGIDPTGGTDPFSPNVVWSGEDRTMDRWGQLSVVSQARDGQVTVFVREMPEWSVKHNDVLVDDAELVVVPPPAAAQPATPPAPGAAPAPPAPPAPLPPLGPPTASDQPQDERYFPQTGYRVTDDVFWDYFNHRGGVRALGYPVSRAFRLLGGDAQIFQRHVMEKRPDGSVGLLNLLDGDVMPYDRFNRARIPAFDAALVATAPRPGAPDYASRVLGYVARAAPDEWNGLAVNFHATFASSVTAADAFPDGAEDPALVPGMDLELWGVPTSQPMADPANPHFVYQRWQRGVMHYDTNTGVTQGLLLGDYFKAIVTRRNLPEDLAASARGSRFLGQYDPTRPNGVSRPAELPDTVLAGAFIPGSVQ